MRPDTSRPYFEHDGVTIYHADCRDVLPAVDPADVDLPSGKSTHVGKQRVAKANTYAPVAGDDAPFDPTHLLRYKRLVLWGGNHYADKLPASPSWLVWDRVSGTSDTADAELAWTNLGGTVRTFAYMWNGVCRAGEKETHGWHPTQKPVALMAWIIDRWTDPGDLILDPYMGSGPVAAAAYQLGRRYIGVELVKEYCDAALRRLAQPVLGLTATGETAEAAR